MSRHFSQETPRPRLNPSQIGSRSCTAEESFYRILHRFFEGCNVEVKLIDSMIIEGKLLGIDGNLEYNGIGNLILSTKEGINIIRGNAVQHLGLRGRKQ